jgi:hypothetical protein
MRKGHQELERAEPRSDSPGDQGALDLGPGGAASEGAAHLGRLERLAGSLPEAHPVRQLAESAVGSASLRGAGYAGSAASRSRSKSEGRISTLRAMFHTSL